MFEGKQKELVVARYNEDISWVKKLDWFNKISIYNKGPDIEQPCIKLPNINREAHTFFYHICENYNNLADVTVFLQGNPFDHFIGGKFDPKRRTLDEIITSDNLNEKFKNITLPETGYAPVFHYYQSHEFGCGSPVVSNRTYSSIFEGYEPNPLIINGAQFIVLKENILSKSLKFYKNNLKNLEIDKTNWFDTIYNAWSYESMWYYIFNKNIKEKHE